jgi:hypothetical protein
MATHDVRDVQAPGPSVDRAPPYHRRCGNRSSGLGVCRTSFSGHFGVAGCRLNRGVPQQGAHHAHVGPLLEQVGGETVAQHVRGHVLLDPGCLGGMGEGRAYGLCNDHLARLARRKQIGRRRTLAGPVLPQPLIERRRQLRLPRLVALAVAYADHPTGPIDVAHLECERLGDAQAGAVQDHHDGLAASIADRAEQGSHLVETEHRRQRPVPLRIREEGDLVRLSERLSIQKRNRRQVHDDPRRTMPPRHELLRVRAKLFPRHLRQWFAEPRRKMSRRIDVLLPRALGVVC